ncbi:MAG: hypothetical protein M0Z55_09990 [Peptococcaceae bacterium]|nr:hypothetical protein [Peptococcaceae bacterium]
MMLLFGLGLVLIGIFSFSAAAYVVLFKIHLNSSALKAVMTCGLGLVVFAMTFAVSIILVWPPYLWSVLE